MTYKAIGKVHIGVIKDALWIDSLTERPPDGTEVTVTWEEMEPHQCPDLPLVERARAADAAYELAVTLPPERMPRGRMQRIIERRSYLFAEVLL